MCYDLKHMNVYNYGKNLNQKGRDMCCIAACLRAIFFCKCCDRKKMPLREAHNISEEKTREIYETTVVAEKPMSVSKIHARRLQEQEPQAEPVDRIDRTAHNRFLSTDVISIGTALRE